MCISKLFWRSKRHLRPFSPVSSMKQIFSYLFHFFCQQLFQFSFWNQVVSIRGFIFPVSIGLKWRLGNSGHCLPGNWLTRVWIHFSIVTLFIRDNLVCLYQNPFAFWRKITKNPTKRTLPSEGSRFKLYFSSFQKRSISAELSQLFWFSINSTSLWPINYGS